MRNNFDNKEIKKVVDSVAREKGISKEIIVEALENAIVKSAKLKFGNDQDIRAKISNDGSVFLAVYTEIVENEEDIINDVQQITYDEIKAEFPDKNVGDYIIDELPAIEYGRVTSQIAKQVLIQKIREGERIAEYEEYKDKIGEIVLGTVKRVEYNDVILEVGNFDLIIKRSELIAREKFKRGDRVRAYVYDVKKEVKGPQVMLSRTHPGFLKALFKQEVPEIYEGVIEIKSVSRDPGSRAKMIVKSADSGIDPVGSCVGLRGVRVQAVVSELQGEKIDIIEWSDDPEELIRKCMAPSAVERCKIKESENKIEVVISEDQLSLAIGRRGQNVRLVSMLLGYDIDVITESQERERREKEFAFRIEQFMEVLGISNQIAKNFFMSGFETIEEISQSDFEEVSEYFTIDEAEFNAIFEKASKHVRDELEKTQNILKDEGIDEDLREFLGENEEALATLVENDVKTIENLADLSSYELVDILGIHGITEKEAEEFIMVAREYAGWFDDEE